jgi:pyruvate kinase
MNNFRFTKVIASVSPLLAKETVLSKIINMVDAFTITLSHGFDDNNKKYIDTLMKLDNSKTIILETKGHSVRVKNTVDVAVKKGQTVIVDYSEYTQDGDKKICVDYAYLSKLPVGALITFQQSQTVLKVMKRRDDYVECIVEESGKSMILQYDRVSLNHYYEEETMGLSERDRKDMLRGLEYGVHAIALSSCQDIAYINIVRNFLKGHHAGDMKVFAKIETKRGLENLDEISEKVDGIILVADLLQPFLGATSVEELVHSMRQR